MRAWASMGSPRVVPVPWASMASMSWVVRWALVRVWWMTCCWAVRLGAVRPLLAPSWLVAVPRMMARMGWLLVMASWWRSRRRSAVPSAQLTPSAWLAKGLAWPLGARPCWRANSMRVVGVAMMVAPPAMARLMSWLWRAWVARWMAMRLEEQAVSMV